MIHSTHRYYDEGADEITFLNITAFRDTPLDDLPLMEVLQLSSERIFVPLCIGKLACVVLRTLLFLSVAIADRSLVWLRWGYP